jgi:hypothetical protein
MYLDCFSLLIFYLPVRDCISMACGSILVPGG